MIMRHLPNRIFFPCDARYAPNRNSVKYPHMRGGSPLPIAASAPVYFSRSPKMNWQYSSQNSFGATNRLPRQCQWPFRCAMQAS